MSEEFTPPTNIKSKTGLSLDYRVIIVVLVLVIAAMLVVWKPWDKKTETNNDRTISVSGEANIKAEPDEYTFNPNYEFKNTDKSAALDALTKKSAQLVAKTKSIGVPDSNIKTGANGYEQYQYYYDPGSRTNTYTLQLNITATNRDQAQKLQDYLVTTEPTGAVSPQVTFSENKKKELQSQARDKATKEARAKADQSAKNLGFKVGTVKSVEDGAGFDNNPCYRKPCMSKAMSVDSGAPSPQLDVQPGQNDLSYSVSVVYYLK